MCREFRVITTTEEIAISYNARIENAPAERLTEVFGYDHTRTAIITSDRPDVIQFFEWGLIPETHRFPKFKPKGYRSIQDLTLNARIEELDDKNSYAQIQDQRCLIITNGFYEHQHKPGGEKQKYLLHLENEQLFTIAGLWSKWQDPETLAHRFTFTMLTMEARGIMREIHNSVLRQPVVLQKDYEMDWLETGDREFPDVDLIATPVGKKANPTLFD